MYNHYVQPPTHDAAAPHAQNLPAALPAARAQLPRGIARERCSKLLRGAAVAVQEAVLVNCGVEEGWRPRQHQNT